MEEASDNARPAAYHLLTVTSGQAGLADWGQDPMATSQPADRGFTVAVTPTADLPAPVAELTVYGYVKGDVIYDFETPTFTPSFTVPAFANSTDKDDHLTLHTYQSRFGIKSSVDTAVGRIRSRLEMDFFGNFSRNLGHLRLRHAYGEWTLAPNWTLLVGQTWRTANILSQGVSLVDFGGSAGLGSVPRAPQVRLTYEAGPLTWANAVERPTWRTDTAMPNLSTFLSYDIPGGHEVTLTGTLADAGPGKGTGWAVAAAANVNLAGAATFTVGGIYGAGEPMVYMGQAPFAWLNADNRPLEAWGVTAGVSVPLTDTATLNLQYGLSDAIDAVGAGNIDDIHTVHGNILWQPVSQIQMGWEVMWGRAGYQGGGHDDATRAQFATWFYF